jgi:hypothetical protein
MPFAHPLPSWPELSRNATRRDISKLGCQSDPGANDIYDSKRLRWRVKISVTANYMNQIPHSQRWRCWKSKLNPDYLLSIRYGLEKVIVDRLDFDSISKATFHAHYILANIV